MKPFAVEPRFNWWQTARVLSGARQSFLGGSEAQLDVWSPGEVCRIDSEVGLTLNLCG